MGVGDAIRSSIDSLNQAQEYDFCDGLRAIAVLWVCADHGVRCVELFLDTMGKRLFALWWPVAIPASGEAGVDIFLVLSGFLIGGALHREVGRSGKISFGQFCLRRFFRIYPAIYSGMLLTAITDAMAGAPAACPNEEWWTSTIILNNLPFSDKLTCMAHTWSVALELQLYLATPFLFMLAQALSKRSQRSATWYMVLLCTIGWAVCGACRLYLTLERGLPDLPATHLAWITIYLSTQYRFGTYIAGVLVGVVVQTQKDEGKRRTLRSFSDREQVAATVALSVSFVVIAAGCYYGGDLSAVSNPDVTAWYRTTFPGLVRVHVALLRPCFGAAVATILYLCANNLAPVTGAFLGHPSLRPIAGLSYSMYLLQFIGFRAMEKPFLLSFGVSLRNAPIFVGMVVTYMGAFLFIVACIPLAFLNYTFVERPGIRLGKYLTSFLHQPARQHASSGVSASAAREEQHLPSKSSSGRVDMEASGGRSVSNRVVIGKTASPTERSTLSNDSPFD